MLLQNALFCNNIPVNHEIFSQKLAFLQQIFAKCLFGHTDIEMWMPIGLQEHFPHMQLQNLFKFFSASLQRVSFN